MSVYVECKAGESTAKNTGALEQCTAGVTIKYALGTPGFKFDTVTDAKDLDKWNESIAAKQIIPLYDAEEYAIADTEAAFYEGRQTRYKTTEAKKIRTFRSVVGLCSYAALESYNEKTMQVFEFTEDGVIKVVMTTDNGVKGQTAKIEVGLLQDAVDGTPQSAVITINYKDFNEYQRSGGNLRPDGWGASDIYGIFDVTLNQVSASATEIKFTVSQGCAGGDHLVTSLLAANIVVKDTTGGVETVSFVPADADGVYTVTGTGFATNYTVGLNGVVTQVGINYESPEPLKITVT